MNNYYPAKSLKLVFSGSDYFETLEKIINEAKDTIHIQTYIFEIDDTGSAVLLALKNAVQRGVRIYVLADAYGSKSLSKKIISKINSDGINFRLFSPLFSSESIYVGRRLHHKIVVADKKIALVGGINIADKYHGTAIESPWLDYAVLITGSINEHLHVLCENLYERKDSASRHIIQAEDKDILIKFTRNDWIKGKNEIHKSYLNAMNISEKSVIFIASYFLPGYRFRRSLKNARKRGVSITVILAGKSDMPFLFYAEKYLYPFFLQHNIRILEWKKSVMHAKAVLVDNDWSTIGSYNLNPVSHYLSIELNVEIKNENFSTEFREHINTMLHQNCAEITLKGNSGKFAWLIKVRNSIMYHFFKFLFLIFISKKKTN